MEQMETTLAAASALLAPWTTEKQQPEANRLDVRLAADDLPAAVAALQAGAWGYLAAITGLDLGTEAGRMEVLYHFCEGAAVVTLRVGADRETPAVPSICPVIPSATFFERELGEMLGITVVGTPNTDYLFLPDEWPAGAYPLRKDFVAQG